MLHHLLLAADTCSKGLFGGSGPGLYDGLCKGDTVDVSALSDVGRLISNVILILLSVAGMLGVVFLIVGGIFYVTSSGDPSQLKRAKDIITNVITGLVVIFVAYAVVTFIANGIG